MTLVRKGGRAAALAVCCIAASLVSSKASAATCSSGTEELEFLQNGVGWEFCWEVTADVGLQITEVYYRTATGLRRRVLKSASLAAVNVQSNDGATSFDHVTSGNFGAGTLVLNAAQCPDGTLMTQGGQAVACMQVEQDGYAAKYYGVVFDHEAVILTSMSQQTTGRYLTRYVFSNTGAISMRVGHAGDIWQTSTDTDTGAAVTNMADPVATGFVNNYVWRIDPDIGANGDDDEVETIEAAPSNNRYNKTMTITRKSSEFFDSIDTEAKRSWRVIDSGILNDDGHIVSYHLEPMEQGDLFRVSAQQAWSGAEFYVTRYDPCERYAKATTGNCVGTVMDYVDGESIAGADVVLWYRTSQYRLPSQEDRSGFDLRWAGLQLKPRDWTDQAEF